jgi:hypothetical protein
MRKVLWYCVGGGAAVALGLMAIGLHACRYPESLVGRYLVTVAGVSSVALQPVAVVGPAAVHHVYRVLETRAGTTHTTGCTEDCAPAEPQPVPEADPVKSGECLQGNIVMGLEQQAAPAPIVIPEDDPPAGQAAVVPSGDSVKVLIGEVEGGIIPQQDQTVPMVMPYCTEEEQQSTDKMPYVSRCEDGTDWQQGLKTTTGSGEVSEPSEPDAVPNCQEDKNYHEHYSGCPYSGCSRATPTCTPGKEEVSEEVLPMPHKDHKKHHTTHKAYKGYERCPTHPEVDTMEYRPETDGKLNEYGPGPF